MVVSTAELQKSVLTSVSIKVINLKNTRFTCARLAHQACAVVNECDSQYYHQTAVQRLASLTHKRWRIIIAIKCTQKPLGRPPAGYDHLCRRATKMHHIYRRHIGNLQPWQIDINAKPGLCRHKATFPSLFASLTTAAATAADVGLRADSDV